MTATMIDGKAVAAEFVRALAGRVAGCAERGATPTLAVVLVGEDPASAVYVRNKARKAAQLGIEARDHRLPTDITTATLLALVQTLNADAAVDGILVQLPLPEGVDAQAVLLAVDPSKDVDGFHPTNLGQLVVGQPRFVPCTPQACMRLLESAGVHPAGKRALVVGRSTIVGKPVAHLLLAAHATVTIAHSRTRDLAAEVARAEIVIAAVGRPKFIEGGWFAEGAAVIDVGINRMDNGKLCGDVDFDRAVERVGAITPVPGGVGPMTIACLMGNVVQAAERRAGVT